MAKDTTTATVVKTGIKRRARKPKSDLQGKVEGLVKLVNEQKLVNAIANAENVDTVKAKSKLYAVVSRIGKSEGLVSKRSQKDVELVFSEMIKLKPSVEEFVNDVKSSITYRSNKTGKRDGSWIRDLLAGVPRLEDGKFKAYIEISEAKAKEICDGMGIDLPEEDEDDEPSVEPETEE